MRPLNGSHYVNIFSHYRPVGDSQWFTRPNPPGTPDPLLDVGECRFDGNAVACDKADLPTLSPTLETLKTSADLYNWWVKVSPPDVQNQYYNRAVGGDAPDL